MMSTKLYGNRRGGCKGRSGMQGVPWHAERLKVHDNKRVSCRDCKNYHECDKSCLKGVDLGAAGYTNWIKCRYFVLEAFAVDSKKQEVLKKRGKKYIEEPLIIDDLDEQISESPKVNVAHVIMDGYEFFKLYLEETHVYIIEKTEGMTKEKALEIFNNEVVKKRIRHSVA